MAREAKALSFVDAVHYAPHQLVDVRIWDCDFLACSAYKFHGPHVGVLYGKKEQLEILDVPKLAPAPDTAPEKLETGTQSHEGIVGAAAAVDFLASLARPANGAHPVSRRERLQAVFDAFHERGSGLLRRLWEELREIRGITVYGPPPSAPRTPTLAFALHGRSAQEVSQLLAAEAIFASHGNFYAVTVV
jgi:selenocysteine lyase/cysteine desulfurase